MEIIDREFPLEQKVELETYNNINALEEILEEKQKGFIGRTKYIEYLKDFCKSEQDENYLGIHAVAGTGKSALLAQFIKKWRQEKRTPIIGHYMSMGNDSRFVNGILQSFEEQLKEIGVLRESDETQELSIKIATTLQNLKDDLIIAIDGLDEIEGEKISWLPQNLPQNIKIIITSRPVNLWEKLLEFSHIKTIELPALNTDEIQTIITNYKNERTIDLSEQDEQSLIKRATGNPLFLKVALDEIAAGGVAVGQLAESVDGLFYQILERLKREHGEEVIDLYLGLISACRGGIAESELEEILSEKYSSMISNNFILRTHKALSNFIIQREFLFHFFHPEFERSVKMLLGKSGIRNCHKELSEYFQKKGFQYERTISELPYQLHRGEKYEDLLLLLSNLTFIETKCKNGMTDHLVKDFQNIFQDEERKIPENLVVSNPLRAWVDIYVIHCIMRAFEIDIQFIRRHPDLVFQSLWNRCYWHDAPISPKHYEEAISHPAQKQRKATAYMLMERWRSRKEQTRGFIWLKSKRPLQQGLNSPLVRTLRGHQKRVLSICYDPYGERIVSGGEDNMVYLWSNTGEILFSASGHTSKVNSVAFSQDNDIFASGSNDTTIRLWSSSKNKCIKVLEEHTSPVTSLTFCPYGNYFASATSSGTIKLWDLKTWKCIKKIKFKSYVWSICFHPDGKSLASSHNDGSTCIWDLATGEKTHTLKESSEAIFTIAFTSTGKQIITGGSDKKIRIWSIDSKQCFKTIPAHKENISGMVIDHDRKKIITVSWDKTIIVRDLYTSKKKMHIQAHDTEVRGIAFNGQDQIATAGADGTIKIWSTLHQGKILNIRGHTSLINNMSFTPDGSKIATGAGDSRIYIWSARNGEVSKVIVGNYREIHSPPPLSTQYKAINKNQELMLVRTKMRGILTYFPATLRKFQISPQKVLAGYSGNYIYILEIAGG